MSGLSDERLVGLVREGGTQAFDELMMRYLRPALAVAMTYAADRDDAEDVVQEAFMRALRQLHRFDARLRFAPWFFTILRNHARNHAARAARSTRLHAADEEHAHVVHRDPASDAEIRAAVERTLAEMTSLQAQCFRLCEIDGFQATEVGDMLGIADATVRAHTHRARLKLREELERLGHRSST